jgi:hypothetical protein
VGVYRKLTGDWGFVTPVALVTATILLFVGLAVALLSTQASKMVAGDRALAQARCAADTGVERIKVFLMADPLWPDGSAAEGPVDETSEVERVTVEPTVRDGKRVAVVASTGRCGKVRKTVRAVIEIRPVPLVAAYNGGLKQLGGAPLEFGSSSLTKSNVLVKGNLSIRRNAAIGLPGEERTVYADGDVSGWKTKNDYAIWGTVYATGKVSPPDTASDGSTAGWTPPVPFPDIGDVARLVGLGRSIAQAVEQATGKQHYFPSGHTFSASELAILEGVYFVEGDASIPGGATNARASIVAAGQIYVTGSLLAERLVLMAAGDIELKNASGTSVALAAAGSDAGWVGGASFKCGALVAGTVSEGRVQGNVTLEQNDEVDFGALAAPIYTARVVSRSEI